MAVVVTFLIGCAFLLGVGCAGVGSEVPQKGQGSSPQATDSEEEARCQGTRPFQLQGRRLTTNDLAGCPKGGPLLGTDKADKLGGKEGDDEIRGLGAADQIFGGVGDDVIHGGPGGDDVVGDDGGDVIYGGPGDDFNLTGDDGDDVIYGGDGNDFIFETRDEGHDKLYCGKGKDKYGANKNDFVSSSCEKKVNLGIPPAGAVEGKDKSAGLIGVGPGPWRTSDLFNSGQELGGL